MYSIAGISKTQQIRVDQQTAVLGGEDNDEYEVTLPPVGKVAGKTFSLRTRRDVTQVKVRASGSDLDEVLGPNEAMLFYSDGTRWWKMAQESVQDQGEAVEPEDETETTEDTGFAAQQEYQTVDEQRDTETVDEDAQERPQEEVSPTPQQEIQRQEGAETSSHEEEDDSVTMESTEDQPEDDSDSGDDESLEDRLKNI